METQIVKRMENEMIGNGSRPSSCPVLYPKHLQQGTRYPYLRVQGRSWERSSGLAKHRGVCVCFRCLIRGGGGGRGRRRGLGLGFRDLGV